VIYGKLLYQDLVRITVEINQHKPSDSEAAILWPAGKSQGCLAWAALQKNNIALITLDLHGRTTNLFFSPLSKKGLGVSVK
jgi:hypothetical protein